MGWLSDALKALSNGESVQVRPQGGSMRGRIESGQLVTIEPLGPRAVCVNDVVLVRWKGSHILHIVKEVRGGDILIGNNIGRINGWARLSDVVGLVTGVRD